MPHPNCGITFLCAHCGSFVTDTSMDSIDPGTRLTCPCKGESVVDLFKPEERRALYQAFQDMELFPRFALAVLLEGPDRTPHGQARAKAKLRDWLDATRH